MQREPVENAAEEERKPKDLRRWHSRLGAALVAPRLALQISDTPAGRGRASSDIALLLLFALVAVETELVSMAGWMLIDGDWSGALTVVMMGARERLAMPIVLLLIATVVLTVFAGKKRSPSDDFDLVCVALVPLVAVEVLHTLIGKLGVDTRSIAVVLGYGWAGVLWFFAFLQIRSRTP